MSDPRPFCFGDCVVDVAARVVLRGGQTQAYEPKVFDALVYLIEHRGRVVSKQELLDNVWGKRVVVTPCVIARTIMKLRRLLGDDADKPTLVKTVHRVGYRFAGHVSFTGHVTHGAAGAVDGTGSRSGAATQTRVAVLPFVNRTGSDALSWVDLGLMTSAIQALRDGGVEVVATAEVLAAVSAADDDLAVAAVLASDIVRATLSRRDDGTLVLSWVGHGHTLDALSGELSGSDPIEVCRGFASQLLLRLAPGRSPATPVQNAYFQAVRARAVDAIADERWESASRLLQLACDAAPDDIALQVDLARCLTQRRDLRALPLARLQRRDGENGAAALESEAARTERRARHRVRDASPPRYSALAAPLDGWTCARFGTLRLDRQRHELSRDGLPQALAPRAFDVLVALIERRHRAVSKDELIARCWGGETADDGALARVIMQLRRSIGHIGDASEVIRTVRGVGYCFDADVELSESESESERDAPPPGTGAAVTGSAPAARLALLPLVNDTGDAGFAWIELGLASMLGNSVEAGAGIAVVSLHEVLVALSGLPPNAPTGRRLQAVRRHLDPDIVVCARMSGNAGHLRLQFEMYRGNSDVRSASVAGAEAAALALQASKALTHWLLPTESPDEAAALDLGDPFLNETFARALQKSREGRPIEAAHLLEVVADGGSEHPEVRHELAKVHVALGAPRAEAEVEALWRVATRSGNAAWLASVGMLTSTLAWQRGDMQRAGAAAVEAAANAERAGRVDLSLRCLIDAARHFGQCFDPRAAALLSRAIPQAERLGNRLLVCHAYYTAGALCGLRNDWVGALRYHEAALAIADTMAETTRGPALTSVGWASIQLGRFEQGCDAGLQAFHCALSAGSQPELGDAAGAAAKGCVAAQRLLDAARLYGQMRALEADRTTAMLIARELLCRVSFLRLTGHIDAALASIEDTRDRCRGHTVYEAYCDVALVRVLFHARRYSELLAVCDRLQRRHEHPDAPLLAPWVERAVALVEHLAFGRTRQALARLHAVARLLPLCEPHGRISLDLAWLHLERGEPELARRLLVPLQSWLEQSPPGLLVQARLHHELGRFDDAVADQRRYVARYAATMTPFVGALLERYEDGQRSGRRQPIERLDGALNFEFGLAPWVVRQLPVELGGSGDGALFSTSPPDCTASTS